MGSEKVALINCPECGKEISDKSKNCIHCGYPLECNDESKKTENTEEKVMDMESTSLYSEKPSETTASEDNNFNFKEFIIKYKKVIVSCLVGVLAIILLFIIFDKPSFEENLSGTWTSSKDSSSGKATVTFFYENDVLSGELTYYDYDESEWGKMSFEVKNHTDYTMTLLYKNGEMDIVSYAVKGSTLVFDGIIYTNSNKNIKNSRTDNPIHIIDGIEYPVWNEMYFGMSKEEVKLILNEDIQKYDGETVESDVPSYFIDSFSYIAEHSNVKYEFKNDKLNNIRVVFFFDYKCTDSRIETFIDNLVDACNSQYGQYDYKGKPYSSADISDTTVYAWEYGNNEITVNYDSDFVYVNLEFSIGQTIMSLYANK